MQCMEEISKEDLFDGLLGNGMFSEKSPPIFRETLIKSDSIPA